jgi:hypothetical protein
LQRRFHRRRRDGEVEKAHRSLVCLQLSRHDPSTEMPCFNDELRSSRSSALPCSFDRVRRVCRAIHGLPKIDLAKSANSA